MGAFIKNNKKINESFEKKGSFFIDFYINLYYNNIDINNKEVILC